MQMLFISNLASNKSDCFTNVFTVFL